MKARIPQEKIDLIRRLRNEGKSYAEIKAAVGVAHGTISKYINLEKPKEST